MIVQGVECPRCKEQIWSQYRHDFHYCTCDYTFVDGGRDYLRYGYGVGLPEGRENDGTVTPEEWAAVAAENARIGIPKIVDIEVPDPAPVTDKRKKEIEKMKWLDFYASLAGIDTSKPAKEKKKASTTNKKPGGKKK